VPDEEKYEVFLRAQKNVVEEISIKAQSADWQFLEPITAERLLCANRVLRLQKKSLLSPVFFISKIIFKLNLD